MSADRFYVWGHRNRKVTVDLARAIELEEAGVKVLVERGPVTAEERAWIKAGAGLN